jgi:hypothetical protein
MKFSKLAFVVASVLSAILFAEVAARADGANQSTMLTFSKPIEIPGQVLPAGTYLLKLPDPNNLHLVQIFNMDQTRLYATLQTVSTQRPEPARDAAVTLADQGPGQPELFLRWFYPGNATGQEFVYSGHKEQQLTQDRQQTVVVKKTAEASD